MRIHSDKNGLNWVEKSAFWDFVFCFMVLSFENQMIYALAPLGAEQVIN